MGLFWKMLTLFSEILAFNKQLSEEDIVTDIMTRAVTILEFHWFHLDLGFTATVRLLFFVSGGVVGVSEKASTLETRHLLHER